MGSYEENSLLARIALIEAQIIKLERERDSLIERVRRIRKSQEEVARESVREAVPPAVMATGAYNLEQKVALIRRLFRGREDVYAIRWESAKTGKSGYQPACENEWDEEFCNKRRGIRCSECSHRSLLPLTDETIARHLTGVCRDGSLKKRYNPDFLIGIYPLLTNDKCWFLAVDFDRETWQKDLRAFAETCRFSGVPVYSERSRSGKGGHVWIFFENAISASLARELGSYILTRTMERRPDIGFESYDRLFPNQDTLPQGGFGNLIALPLQYNAVRKGNSLFVDEQFIPYADQCAYLNSIALLKQKTIEDIVGDARSTNRVTGVRTVVTDGEDDTPWTLPPSRRQKEDVIPGPLPETLTIVRANQIFIERDRLPTQLIHKIIKLAAFQNPEFYKAQAMRYSTYGIPRIISRAEMFPHHIALPRGCEDELTKLLESLKMKPFFKDERNEGEPIVIHFQALLRPEQLKSAQAMLSSDIGVLSAPTAFGKTIIAAYLIAKRKVNTLVLVHRIQLLEQWIERLSSYFGIESKMIGQIRGGKKRPSGFIDIAVLQSLRDKKEVNDIVATYGHIIIDECHHIPAVSFEQILQACRAKYITGLSATVVRKDGLHPIVFMQCGPLRHKADFGKSTQKHLFKRTVIIRETPSRFNIDSTQETRIPIQEIYRALLEDDTRNHLIIKDVLESIGAGRFPIILTERKDHVDKVSSLLSAKGIEVIILKGGMKRGERKSALEKLTLREDGASQVIVATGRYIGEGFDYAPLDTLFLAMPISWRGTLAQYAGRLHRLHEEKREVRIYDYVDCLVPVLERMLKKRLKGYKLMGYEVIREPSTPSPI